MKKLVSIGLALLCMASFVSCADPDLGEPIAGTGERGNQFDTYTVTARYDYGMHRPELATILYDSSTAFFSLPDGIDAAIAGDVFTIEYSGQLLIQESHPSSVVFDGGKVESVSMQKAKLARLTYDPSTERFLLVGEESEEAITVAEHPDYYITDDEGHFEALTEVGEPLTLFASYSPVDGYDEGNGYRFAGLYTSYPRSQE